VLKKLVNQSKVLLILIVILGAFFRFSDINWDQGQHLHPDERFLTMVGTDMKLPRSFATYLTPQLSSMNPANIGHSFYVYGTFPVIFNKLFAIYSGADTYNDFSLLGRMLSGFVDLLMVVIVFKTAELFEKRYKVDKNVKYWSAFFYAIAVLPIQLAHFFTVDTFLSAFAFLSFYSALKFSFDKKVYWLLLSGIFFGLALASKVTAIFIFPLLLYFLINAYAEKRKIEKKKLLRLVGDLVLFGIATYLSLRITDPYLFQNASFFDLKPSELFLKNLNDLKAWSDPKAWYPPGVQWIHKTPVLFALKNIVLYGIGIGYAACCALGIWYLFKKIKNWELYLLLGWVVLFFLYQSLQSVQTMRYFLILYPFLALFAGIGFAYFAQHKPKWIQGILLFLVIIWPVLFFSIYTQPITRYTASNWIYNNVPANSIILTESWDDGLPLPIFDMSRRNYIPKQLPVFDPDTPQKWETINSLLKQGNYLILSSNRGWGSIPTVPERFPLMKKFYEDLIAGKTKYKEVAQFTSYPSLTYLGIPLTISDDNAEEAFTVYDHPKVMIFKNENK
jgi:4-amino-4-deoxy-L-arabinose transferase-like glycosyltransferase